MPKRSPLSTLFSFFAGTPAARRSRAAVEPTTLGVEDLERREMMAGDVKFASGVLTITGDATANTAQVSIKGSQVQASVSWAKGAGTAGSVVRSYAASTVKEIRFTGLAGDDKFTNATAIKSNANGGDGNDLLQGGTGIDLLYGGAGNDQLKGGGGNDSLYGDAGNDALEGQAGDDLLAGGEGDDVFVFSGMLLGSDRVADKPGQDTLDFRGFSAGGIKVDLASTSLQTIESKDLMLKLDYADAVDHVFGSKFNDMISGNALANHLSGGDGNDVLVGRTGNDKLYGEKGNDDLRGDDGDDLLDGGAGRDTFNDGRGWDHFKDDFVLFLNGATLDDVEQGESPVCAVLAPIGAAIGRRDWSAYVKAVGKNQFDVKLFDQRGVAYWERVTFDGTWSDQDATPTVSGDGLMIEAWVVILQRAVLERHGVNWNALDTTWAKGWQTLDEGLQAIAGGFPSWNSITNVSAAWLAKTVDVKLVAAATKASGAGDGILSSHGYAVLDVYQQGSAWFVSLYNPWGVDSAKGALTGADDGRIVVSWAVFTRNFVQVAWI